jgi:sarcosine oxidase subunit beta
MEGRKTIDGTPSVVVSGLYRAGLPVETTGRFLKLRSPFGGGAKQLANGRVLASHLRATGDPAIDGASWRRHVRSCILELLPRLEYVSLPLLVEGLYDVTPDNQAIVGAVPGRPGLWIAAGFSGHGFMIAPEVGRAVAAQLYGEDPGAQFAELAVDRFARGALAPETSVV